MKRKILLLVSIVLMFILFYNQNIGLNLFIFNIFLIVSSLVLIRNFSIQILLSIVCCIISSASFVYYGDNTSVFANILSIGIFSILMHNKNLSLVLFISQTISKFVISPYIFISVIINNKSNLGIYKSSDIFKKTIFFILLPAFILIVFVLIYMQINPIIHNYIRELDISFPSMKLIFSILFYCMLMYTFWYKQKINFFAKIDVLSVKELKLNDDKVDNIYILKSGIISFSLLNILIIFLLLTDFNYLVLNNNLPDTMSLSEYVHAGVNASIFSIVFAISLIMIFLSGNRNFSNKIRPLLYLCSIWIVLNIILALSICAKNNIYIDSFGLTEKRIGVYIYTFIACVGLVICLIKIHYRKSNLFLIRNMYWVFILVLVSSGPINWSRIITSHNIEAYKNNEITLDVNHLCRLNNYNIDLLLDLYQDDNLENSKKDRINEHICRLISEFETKDNDFFSFILFDNINEKIIKSTDTKLMSFYDYNFTKLPSNDINCLKQITKLFITNIYSEENFNDFLDGKNNIIDLTINNDKSMVLSQIKNPEEIKYLNIGYNYNLELIDILQFKNIVTLCVYHIKTKDLKFLKQFKKLKKIEIVVPCDELKKQFPGIQVL